MELPEVGGIEPDYCFYIERWQAAMGGRRLDWRVDPPPDLVIEIDVTSYSAARDYLPYAVPEVWLFRKTGLQIYALQAGDYSLQRFSRYFPQIDLPDLIACVLQTASEQGSGVALRDLRRQLMQ